MASPSSKSKWAVRAGIVVAAALLAVSVRQNWLHTPSSTERVIPVSAAFADTEKPPAKPVIAPEQLYHKAWVMIQDMFYDKKFNNQDWDRWHNRYDGKIKTSEDAHKVIETMIASLGDPYTRFLSKESFTEEKDQIAAHLYGVGMQLGMHEHKVVVIAPIQDTPAYKAGIHPGDEIVEVDNKPVKGQSLDTVVKQIRGPVGTQVAITIMRGTERKTSTMTRAEVPIKAVASAEMLPNNIGYIRLDSFISHKANDEMREALKKNAGAKGIILDLRNNPGGLLSNAIEISNMFLDHGTIVSTVDADGYMSSTISSRRPISNLPMVVLINGGSASASEILSGALHDNHRATLVGQKSFGKGLVQSINRMDDGSGINITIARYLTPNGTDIHKTGIAPDYVVEVKEAEMKADKGPWWIDPTYTNFKRTPNDGHDIQLNKAIEVLKAEIASGNTVANKTTGTNTQTP